MKRPHYCIACHHTFDRALAFTCPYCGASPPPCPDLLCIRWVQDPQICAKCPVEPAPSPQPLIPALPVIRVEGRGGRRAGAGAPKGNLNHLKDGSRSNLIRKAVDKLADDPELRVLFLVLARATVDGEIPKTTRKLIQRAIQRGDL